MSERTITFDPPISCEIEYMDKQGQATRRTVDIEELHAHERAIVLYGYCYLRDEYRHFRADRIQEVITDDGECISAQEFLKRHNIHFEAGEPAKRSEDRAKKSGGIYIWTAIVAFPTAYFYFTYPEFEDRMLTGAMAIVAWLFGLIAYSIFRIIGWIGRKLRGS